ncbi:hypothetical protein EPA93_47195 [Ktedonosporobacter rubrisoli]|uniref:FAD-binding domain-containing protein n=1 Tax=Ktedonosporobacter rubrisoli TaxID=2509675 RepID=A0A4P6K5J4_KTERU|nr:FAD-dependent monooxygenase [Ktedonosporobacter rubrisoli]QBD83150.1 hypothetical protein EPA93_47195 [Ktedonosporobacter rubrisoli]
MMSEYTTTYDQEVPVLIVGGSVVGLSTALFLAWHGIPSLLVERHATTSIHGRAGGFNARTMELFRQVGIEEEIFALETPPEQLGEMGLRVESLTGKVLDTTETRAHQQFQQENPFPSPTRMAMLGQDKLEPILRAHASTLGSDIRFGTEMLSFRQDDEGVSAQIRELATGKEFRVRARYLVAADGNRSAIRRQLDIPSHGYGILGDWISILFRTDLSKELGGRKITLCFVNNPTVEGIMGYSGVRWALLANLKPRAGERPDALSPERCLELVRAAIGIPDQPVEIISTLYWELASRVAERFQQGRVLLAGDAAHVMTTMGGFGANTGIADAHNLAWKLATVLKGTAHPELLTSYAEERQIVANLAVSFSTGLYAYRLPNHEHREAIAQSAQEMLARVRKDPDAPAPSALSVASGYLYRSTAIIAEGEDNGVLYENRPSSRPGTRAPHIWLMHNAKRISILDLYGKNFVLLTGAAGIDWQEATKKVKNKLGLALDVYQIGSGTAYSDEDEQFLTTYGINCNGAVLVRPDGFIAWRTPLATTDKLESTLVHILSR